MSRRPQLVPESDPLVQYVKKAIEASLHFWATQAKSLELGAPPAGSLAAQDLAESFSIGDSIADPVAAAFGLAIDTLRATEDSLRAALRCLHEPVLIVGASPPLRTTFEGSLRACWLLDPRIAAKERAERFVRDYVHVHKTTAGKLTTIAERIRGSEPERAQAMQDQADLARATIADIHGRLTATGYVDDSDVFKKPPPVEQLGGLYLAPTLDTSAAFGIAAYQQLSAPAHVTAYGLKRYWGEIAAECGPIEWHDWGDCRTPLVEDASYALIVHGLAVGLLAGQFGGSVMATSDQIESINDLLKRAWSLAP